MSRIVVTEYVFRNPYFIYAKKVNRSFHVWILEMKFLISYSAVIVKLILKVWCLLISECSEGLFLETAVAESHDFVLTSFRIVFLSTKINKINWILSHWQNLVERKLILLLLDWIRTCVVVEGVIFDESLGCFDAHQVQSCTTKSTEVFLKCRVAYLYFT